MNHSERIELVKARYSAFSEEDHPREHGKFSTKHHVLEFVKKHGEVHTNDYSVGDGKSLGDMRHELGHKKFDAFNPLKNPVHKAAKELIDSGHIKAEQRGRGHVLTHTGKELDEKERYAADEGDSKIEKTMHEFKEGELHSGSKSGPEVANRKQAVAIALSQARKAGAHIPPK